MKQVVRKVLFPPCLIFRAYSIITNKDHLTKENTRITLVLKNEYQESIIKKIFKKITKNHSLSQSQQQTQATDIQEDEIKMSINLPYIEGTSENCIKHILRFHKIRSIFYTKNTLLSYFENRKIEQIQKIKTSSLMKL